MLDEMLATPTLSAKDMPYLMFYSESVPDVQRTKDEGRACYKDQHFVVVTVPGDTKSNFKDKADAFFEKKKLEVETGRIPQSWLDKWKQDYALFVKGQEIPIDGTPIKGWKLLTGAQQDELVRMHILTVEQLAELSGDAQRAFGMGALELKRKAKAWLDQNLSHEKGALKMADLTRENDSLKGQLQIMAEKLEELEKALASKKGKSA